MRTDTIAIASSIISLIFFHLSLSPYCKAIKPRLEALVKTYCTGASFYEVEFMGNRDLCKQVNIQRLPTLQVC